MYFRRNINSEKFDYEKKNHSIMYLQIITGRDISAEV